MKSKEQSFWTLFAIFAVVLLGGSGFYFYTSYSKFKEADTGFANLRTKTEKLLSAPIYPTSDNRDKLVKQAGEYEIEVEKLYDALGKFAQDLESIRAQDFPREVKNQVEAINALSLDPKNPVKLPDEFYLGFDKYRDKIPSDEAAGILKFQLDSVVHLVRLALDNGANRIFALQREETPQERGDPDPEETELVTKYTVTFSFRTSHEGYRNFVNLVSNDSKYFYIIRILRVDNESKEGPERDYDQGNVVVDKDGNPVVDPPDDVDDSEFQVLDARVIFGEEKLMITAVIDLCRFPKQENEDAPAAAEGENE
ncbi:MAG: hypothetical protein ACI8UO_004846 [Verrucomicrobiales bacterium]|jgi:hypothetical protein